MSARKLTPAEMETLTLMPDAGPRAIRDAIDCDGQTRGEEFYKNRVRAGWMKCVTISGDGVPMFNVYYFLTVSGTLNISAMFSLDHRAKIDVAVLGAEALAKKENCVAVEFCTEISGLYQVARRAGYKTIGVQMAKTL
jgi:hypothetical protein